MSIKSGDLVMVVKPALCCGSAGNIGRIFTVLEISHFEGRCIYCGHVSTEARVMLSENGGIRLGRLKKIDPPADGDSLPTRKDIEVTA